MIPTPEPAVFCPTSRQHWREWLQAHHATRPAIWLVYQKKQSPTAGITYGEAVEEALCFGWIDSKSQPIDAHTYRQFFSRRKPGSTWSKVNKARVQRLLAAGQLAPAGLSSIETAKQNGSWLILDEVEALVIPADLAQEFQQKPTAAAYFARLCRSDKRNLLQWLVLAKRPATRQKRLAELVALADQQQKPAFLSGQKKR